MTFIPGDLLVARKSCMMFPSELGVDDWTDVAEGTIILAISNEKRRLLETYVIIDCGKLGWVPDKAMRKVESQCKLPMMDV